MARRRIIDPLFWDDPDIVQLTRDERLLFVGLISFSDDYAHITGNAGTLRKWVFGYDDITVAQVQDMLTHILATCRNVEPYEHEGQCYLWLKKWEKHQDLRFRAKAQYPCHVCFQIHDASTYKSCPAFTDLHIYTQDSDVDTRTKRREEKRREEKNHLRGDESPQERPPKQSDRPTAEAKLAKGDAQPRRNAAHFAALARVCGFDLAKLTGSERGLLNKAASELAGAGYSPDSISVMAGNYASHFGNCVMTPSALVKHATLLMEASAVREPRRRDGWNDFGNRRKPPTPEVEYQSYESAMAEIEAERRVLRGNDSKHKAN